jgi:hypothetical protein
MTGEKAGAVIVPVPRTFKVPQYVSVSAASLPRNPGGTLLKRALRDNVEWSETGNHRPL